MNFSGTTQYKAAMRGGEVVVADRFYASSKTCSACEHKLDVLPLSVRRWTCPACGATHDRDINAAINLKTMAQSCGVMGSVAQARGSYACGEAGSGARRKAA
ncbi:transposase [Tepidimonas taiwanensis]|uniref:Putative transposase DNA-binding domain protein n=1 Tax=Tepidimonas taiwanensis TaxID=307486 RepID=A0A554X0X0_9BURK|nr:zinc ribbon domain-containing protein [Tepidimonas taiwanensis]TSE29484.1 putative transposase DNA-binding domain protein [Tepidimonas taiwanensis]UBQ05882.1 transposase [Tepidimonas taiwanensis]